MRAEFMLASLAVACLLASAGPAYAQVGTSWFEASPKLLSGNSIQLLETGAETDAARREMISHARRTIYVSAFAWHDDETGRAYEKLLCARARDGIEVRMLLDAYGSKPVQRHSRELRDCGIKLEFFAPTIEWGARGVLRSLHEKLLIVDGESVLTGGSGYDDGYAGQSRDSERWYDLDARIDGPAACAYHRMFQQSFVTTAQVVAHSPLGRVHSVNDRDDLAPDAMADCEPVMRGSSRVIPKVANPYFSKERPLLESYLAALAEAPAGERVLLYAPYFVPDLRFESALLDASARGVEIEVLTNSIGSSDDKAGFGTEAMIRSTRRLREGGIQIHLWPRSSVMHRKGGVFGSRLAYFGSDNLDRRGQEFQSESVVWTDEPAVLTRMREMLEQDLSESPVLDPALVRDERHRINLPVRLLTRFLGRQF